MNRSGCRRALPATVEVMDPRLRGDDRGRTGTDSPPPPPISGKPEMGFLLRKSGTPDLRWGGGGGGGVSDSRSKNGANTPTRRFALTLPTRGRGKARVS